MTEVKQAQPSLRKTPLKEKGIRKAEEFNLLFQSGRRISTRHYMVFCRDSDGTRFGLAVSRAIRKAVARNAAKRRTKEIIRKHLDCLPKNKRFVLLAKAGVERERFRILEAEVLKLFGLLERS